ncbi:MAG TPA: SDR family oxidoreductase [Solirubrobacteraceae bacterium]|jgi:3-oxoacyl-[acyl-carrier protein] reductase|nr:SDR family oxidoreductase [Solirubrobacteraceae bacterium]
MDLGLAGRVALVTGASRGIGRAIAAELAAEGARVAISSRSLERTEPVAREIGAEAFAWDSADLDGAPRLLAAVAERLGPIDVLVCNTGGPPGGPDALGFTREQWEQAYRTLVLGPMALVEAVVPAMRERGWGRVLNVASTTAIEPTTNLVLSNAHRVAMVAAFKTIAREVAAEGVTLNTLLPGRIATDRLVELYGSLEQAEEAARAVVPADRLGSVEDMAAAAAFLCSARAGYVTGQRLAIDGGLLQSI